MDVMNFYENLELQTLESSYIQLNSYAELLSSIYPKEKIPYPFA